MASEHGIHRRKEQIAALHHAVGKHHAVWVQRVDQPHHAERQLAHHPSVGLPRGFVPCADEAQDLPRLRRRAAFRQPVQRVGLLQRFGRRVKLQAPAVAALAQRPREVDRRVTDLPCVARRAVVDLTVCDQPRAHAPVAHHVQKVLVPAVLAVPEFRQRAAVGVVLKEYGEAKTGKPLLDVHLRPAGKAAHQRDALRAGVVWPRQGHAQPQDFPRRAREGGFYQHPQLFKRGDRAQFRAVRNLVVGHKAARDVENPAGQVAAVDPRRAQEKTVGRERQPHGLSAQRRVLPGGLGHQPPVPKLLHDLGDGRLLQAGDAGEPDARFGPPRVQRADDQRQVHFLLRVPVDARFVLHASPASI